MAEPPSLVVGLGNPGDRYAGTRHNAGRMVVEELASRMGARFAKHRTGAFTAEGRLSPGGPRVVLAIPQTYMNESGRPAGQLARFYDVGPDRVVVVHDELDLPFGVLKLKTGGGHGGHNGVRDVAAVLGSPEFARVRVGVGRPNGRQDPADWVLAPFSAAERKELSAVIATAADAVELLLTDGLTAAQQRYNGGAG